MGWASTISICASLSASQREADPGAGTGALVEQGSFRFRPPVAGSGGRALWKKAWGLEQQGATSASRSRGQVDHSGLKNHKEPPSWSLEKSGFSRKLGESEVSSSL